MADSSPLSPRGAVIIGLFVVACGIAPVLGGLGLIPLTPTEDTPPWVAVAAGAMFVLGGAALIVGFAIGRAGPDGDFAAGTPFAVRLTQYLLGLGIVGLLTAITGWIAFGPGQRHFSMSMTLPFLPLSWTSGDTPGRAIFGVAAVLMAIFLVALVVVGFRRLGDSRSRG